MYGFQARNRQNAANSSRAPGDPSSTSTAAVGEIDTAAPFASVKAAVTLFVEASPKPDTPVIKKSRAIEESVLGKETQLHWILKDIDKHREYVKNAEATREKALKELDKANKTIQELTNMLDAASESKNGSIQAIEASDTRLQELEELKSTKKEASDHEAWQETVDNERSQYKTAANQLIAAKQEFNNLKQDFDLALEAKLAAVQRAAEAQHAAELNRKKVKELSKDVVEMSVTLERVKFASGKAEDDYAKLVDENEIQLKSKKNANEETELKIQSLKKETEDTVSLQKRLEETTGAVTVIEEQLKEVRAVDIELLKNANSELDDAKKLLEETKGEEISLREAMESLKLEVEDVKKEVSISIEEELNREKLQTDLEQMEVEFQQAVTEKTLATTEAEEIELKIREMLLEAEKARAEEDELKRQVEKLWREAQLSETEIHDAETNLEVAEKEVEEAQSAKELANDQMRERSCTKEVTNSDSDNMILLSTMEFEALSKVAEEAVIEADTKVEGIMDEVETIRENERGILEKLEKSMEEQKEIEAGISEAVKSAKVADEARKTIESELRKWREEIKG
ncbi:hypothetical protein LXL04_026971 [Taraxacum kok-saghyz]